MAIKLNEIISVSSYTIYFNDFIYFSLGATERYNRKERLILGNEIKRLFNKNEIFSLYNERLL